MWFWWITVVVIIAGALGGGINALTSDSGFILPGWYDEAGNKIWKPGALGNVFLGAGAAFISWGLYGPFAEFILLPPDPEADVNLTLSAVVGAFLVGVAGSRVITSEVEKNVLSKTAVQTATLAADPELAGDIASASKPSGALSAVSEAREAYAEAAAQQQEESQRIRGLREPPEVSENTTEEPGSREPPEASESITEEPGRVQPRRASGGAMVEGAQRPWWRRWFGS